VNVEHTVKYCTGLSLLIRKLIVAIPLCNFRFVDDISRLGEINYLRAFGYLLLSSVTISLISESTRGDLMRLVAVSEDLLRLPSLNVLHREVDYVIS
jgi:hypothetical protein